MARVGQTLNSGNPEKYLILVISADSNPRTPDCPALCSLIYAGSSSLEYWSTVFATTKK